MKNNNFSGGLFTKRPAALTIKETPLSAQIAEYLNLRRIYNDRINSGKAEVIKRYFCKKTSAWKNYTHWLHLAKDGTPDRFAILKGRIIFIEVKQLGKKPEPNQLERQAELIAAGAIVINCDSFDDFQAKFKEVEKAI
jgi:hypothetical protein